MIQIVHPCIPAPLGLYFPEHLKKKYSTVGKGIFIAAASNLLPTDSNMFSNPKERMKGYKFLVKFWHFSTLFTP